MFFYTEHILNQAKTSFNIVGYQPRTSNIDINTFNNYFICALNHAKTLNEAASIIAAGLFVFDKMNFIIKKANKYSDFWNNLVSNQQLKNIKQCDSKNSKLIYVTNGLGDANRYYFSGMLLKNKQLIEVAYNDGYFYLNKTGSNEYYLKDSVLNKRKLTLLNSEKNPICSFSINNKIDIIVKDNKSNFVYKFIKDPTFNYITMNLKMEIYDKNDADKNKPFASIEHTKYVLFKNNAGIVKLKVNNKNADIKIAILISIVLIYLVRQQILYANQSTSNGFLTGVLIGTSIFKK